MVLAEILPQALQVLRAVLQPTASYMAAAVANHLSTLLLVVQLSMPPEPPVTDSSTTADTDSAAAPAPAAPAAANGGIARVHGFYSLTATLFKLSNISTPPPALNKTFSVLCSSCRGRRRGHISDCKWQLDGGVWAVVSCGVVPHTLLVIVWRWCLIRTLLVWHAHLYVHKRL